MRVAFDTHPLHTTRAGVARYVRRLLAGLEAACPEIGIEPIAWPYDNFEYKQPRRAWRTFYRELVWARWAGPRALGRSGADLWFSPALPLFAPRSTPHVAVLHDLAVLRQPGRYRRWQRLRARARLRLVSQAERIICVSRFTADEAMALLGLPASRLEVVHNGVTRLPEGRLPGGVPAEYFLFVGTLEPGKNVELLRRVWLLAERRGVPLPALCLVGERWPGVAREGAAPRSWRFLGGLDGDALGALYRGAVALVFPSLYEGFGLPVLEAMACGCPVVCAPVASLPEIAGDAACLTPHDPEAWCGALQRLASDGGYRGELVRRGLVRADAFSWEHCARETAAVWRSVVR